MKQRICNMLILGMVICFCVSVLPSEALAAKGNHHKYDSRHERIIINSIHINDRHLGYVKNNRLSLRDLIVAKAIADESRYLDTEDVLRLMKRGYSHKKIAKKYHVNWRKVDKRVDNAYKDMKRSALKIGLNFWSLDEILN